MGVKIVRDLGTIWVQSARFGHPRFAIGYGFARNSCSPGPGADLVRFYRTFPVRAVQLSISRTPRPSVPLNSTSVVGADVDVTTHAKRSSVRIPATAAIGTRTDLVRFYRIFPVRAAQRPISRTPRPSVPLNSTGVVGNKVDVTTHAKRCVQGALRPSGVRT